MYEASASIQAETMEMSLMFSGHCSLKFPSIAFPEKTVIQQREGIRSSKYYPVLRTSPAIDMATAS